MISNGFFSFVFFFTSLVILGFPKKEITLFDKTQFCCFFFFFSGYTVSEWVGDCDVYRSFFYVLYTVHILPIVYVLSKYDWNIICCVWTGGGGLYALISEFSFFLFDQSGYQKHAGGFLWLFGYLMQAYMGWYVYEKA